MASTSHYSAIIYSKVLTEFQHFKFFANLTMKASNTKESYSKGMEERPSRQTVDKYTGQILVRIPNILGLKLSLGNPRHV